MVEADAGGNPVFATPLKNDLSDGCICQDLQVRTASIR